MAETTTLIGNGRAGFSGDGPLSADTTIAEPFGLVTGPDQALYFCDLGNHRIRRINNGFVETFVGTGEPGNSGDGGKATDATITEPYELRFDRFGALYFVDRICHVVRRVLNGRIETVAGTGEAGFSGDGGPAMAATFTEPHSIEFDSKGVLYIADIGNHRVRQIDPETARIETFAGTGNQSPTDTSLPVDRVDLNGPRAIAFNPAGDMILALREGNSVYRIDRESKRIEHIAGSGEFGYNGDGSDARTAALAGPKGVAVDEDSNIYLADTESHTVRRISAVNNHIATVMGTGRKHDGPDGNPNHCGLARPHGVHIFGKRLYVGDSDNHRVRTLKLPD